MKFLVDESADARLATYLSTLGHDARTVARDYAASLEDTDVLSIAHREERILITNDRDFGDLIFRHGRRHSGVIYLRLSTTQLSKKVERLDHVLASHGGRLEHFIVVTDRSVRVRSTGSNSGD